MSDGFIVQDFVYKSTESPKNSASWHVEDNPIHKVLVTDNIRDRWAFKPIPDPLEKTPFKKYIIVSSKFGFIRIFDYWNIYD